MATHVVLIVYVYLRIWSSPLAGPHCTLTCLTDIIVELPRTLLPGAWVP